MNKLVRIIKTEYYSDVFSALCQALEGKTADLSCHNLVFCEEKSSLTVERAICQAFKGSFNTDVYSFGKYLKKIKSFKSAISKEGSAMAVRYVLSKTKLSVLNPSRTMLASSLYELIIQLKSAKVTPEDLFSASENLNGLLKNKIRDIGLVFEGYERFISERNLVDQSGILQFLPELILNDSSFSDKDVFLVGYSSFTAQARSIVSALIKKAKSVTAILTGGQDENIYINETIGAVKLICKEQSIPFKEENYNSGATKEAEFILKNALKANVSAEKIATNKVESVSPLSTYEEAEFIAETIKKKVIEENYRYRDFTVALPSINKAVALKEAFNLLEIPFFLDEKQKVENHPLIKLIASYIEVFRKNFERNAFLSFIKNPLIIQDVSLADRFENYIRKFNLNYNKFLTPLKFGTEEEIIEFEPIREKTVELFSSFNVNKMLDQINAGNKVEELTKVLSQNKEHVYSAISVQAVEGVKKLLSDINTILAGEKLSFTEYKKIFLSGVSAMEISIIPQYTDAVFVGEYKNTSLIRARVLFAMGLDSSVPLLKEDVALISDADIKTLSKEGVVIEPKIKHVNRRAKEETLQALSAFSEKLYLSVPIASEDGKIVEKSTIISNVETLFDCKNLYLKDGFYTISQGLLSFAEKSSEFVAGALNDFSYPASFYTLVKSMQDLSFIERATNRENKEVLNDCKEILCFNETYPTTIESFNSCPYKTFLEKGIGLKNREEGELDHLVVGTLTHDVLEQYVKAVYVDKSEEILNREQSDAFVETIIENVTKRYSLNSFKEDDLASFKLSGIVAEAKEFCFRLKNQLDDTNFKPYLVEEFFGTGEKKNAKLSAISLDGGKIKLCGKIDRVDKFGDYFRVIDYKTGSLKVEEKFLFNGTKLQLYLYALAVKEGKIAGLYYQPINESGYASNKEAKTVMVGKTCDIEEALFAQDLNLKINGKSNVIPVTIEKGVVSGADTVDHVNAYVDYALRVSDTSAKNISKGVIVASPDEKACEYCNFKGICSQNAPIRKLKEVDKTVIIRSTGREV